MDSRALDGESRVSRRAFLDAAGIAGVSALAGCGGGGSGTPTAEQIGNYPVTGDVAVFGFNVSQSGPFSIKGQEELRGQKLAVKHINEGGGWVGDGSFDALSGDGLLGKQVDFVTMDTEGDAEVARENARLMIDDRDAIMLSGGSTSDTGLAQQSVAADGSVIYMPTSVHIDRLTGTECNRFTFREMFNARMTVKALVPVLREEYGVDTEFFTIFADNEWGKDIRPQFGDALRNIGWRFVGSLRATVGTTDYTRFMSDVKSADPAVLVLALRGLDAANAVRQFREEFPELDVVVPLFSRAVAQTAGGAIEDVIGTIAWDPAIDTPLSNSLIEAYGSTYEGGTGAAASSIPSGPAQVGYTQTLLYANAVARAGTFDPEEVIATLEDSTYAAGMGKETMRACDHQSMRPVPVVKGRAKAQQNFGRYYDLVDTKRDATYDCGVEPASECTFGGS